MPISFDYGETEMSADLTGKRILITGGTGSLGKVLLRRLLSGQAGEVARVAVLSRDEAKQHQLRLEYLHRQHTTDDVVYRNVHERLSFYIGDVRDPASLSAPLRNADIVFNAAALKQVPTCEYFPTEAVMTNVMGANNIARVIREQNLAVETVVGVSTDKAVQPVNVMGMTKALQERIFLAANLDIPTTRFVLVRYGNVLASRGSVIPYFHEQIRAGQTLTITDDRMTRFLLSLEDAVDVILAAVSEGRRGETYIPRVPAALITDVAKALIGDRPIATRIVGIRPGEKLHECLVSSEESVRTYARGRYYVVAPILPELVDPSAYAGPVLERPYMSNDDVMDFAATRALLERHRLMVDDELELDGEILR
jgi:FlaA1/EpsC-like NDP-sugar epimerase